MWSAFSVILVVCLYRLSGALEQCDRLISDQFLARRQLYPTALQYLCGNSYWRAAVATYVATDRLVTFQHGPLVNNACNMSLVEYNKDGSVALQELLILGEVLEDKYLCYFISNMMAGYYTFQCRNNLVAMYRCQMSWKFGGPKYLVYAPLSMSESEISQERDICKKEITVIDGKADIVDNHYPSFS